MHDLHSISSLTGEQASYNADMCDTDSWIKAENQNESRGSVENDARDAATSGRGCIAR